jgi:hypothetical protein
MRPICQKEFAQIDYQVMRHAFDSQNVPFWSETEKKYVLYYRVFYNGRRTVERAVSDDFLNWAKEGEICFPDGGGPQPLGQFYTNQIRPYYRAPQLYIGFPARYTDNGNVLSTQLLPEPEERVKRSKYSRRFGTATTDAVYIVSRDGIRFRQSNDVFLAPGHKTKHNWAYGDNYIMAGLLETASPLDDEPRELSLFASESRFTGRDTRCRRYTLRIDGFASIHAKSKPGVVDTRPFVFDGRELSINYSTSGRGNIRIEIRDPQWAGSAISGFSANRCDLIFGDTIDRKVSWRGNPDVSGLAGRPIVLRFVLQEADVYSFKFS